MHTSCRLIGLVVLVCYAENSFPQLKLDIPLNQRVVINFMDHIVYAEILTTDNKIKPAYDSYYYWFNANDIKRTRGGFDGKLLHGTYTDFYNNKNLKEKGKFKYGLKQGEWKAWYFNGELKEIFQWKKGERHGKYKEFSKDGELIKVGVYKNDKLKGKNKSYEKGELEINRYKKGILKIRKKPGKFNTPVY